MWGGRRGRRVTVVGGDVWVGRKGRGKRKEKGRK